MPTENNKPSFMSKAAYLGTGVFIGLLIYPAVKKMIDRAKPHADDLFNSFVGKSEGVAETVADFVATARQNIGKEQKDKEDTQTNLHS